MQASVSMSRSIRLNLHGYSFVEQPWISTIRPQRDDCFRYRLGNRLYPREPKRQLANFAGDRGVSEPCDSAASADPTNAHVGVGLAEALIVPTAARP